MITTEIKKMSPHSLAGQLFNRVTYSMQDVSKIFEMGLYGKFIILGSFLRCNSLAYQAGMNPVKLKLAETEMTELVNKLLKSRYRIENFLPYGFNLLRTLWQRPLCSSELALLDKLYELKPDLPGEVLDEAEILLLGLSEATRRVYWDRADQQLASGKEVVRMLDCGNGYLEQLTGIKNMITIDELELTHNFK